MRAKFIFEKFTDEDSDPIKDMGIGFTKKINDWIHTEAGYYGKTLHFPDNKNEILDYCMRYSKKEFMDFLVSSGAKFADLSEKAKYILLFSGKYASLTPEEELIIACQIGDLNKFETCIDNGVKLKIGMVNSLFKPDWKFNGLSSKTSGKQNKILEYLKDNMDILEDIIHPRDLKKLDKIKSYLNINKPHHQDYPNGYKIYRITKFVDDFHPTSENEIVKFAYELSHGKNAFNPLLNASHWKDGFDALLYPFVHRDKAGVFSLNQLGKEKLQRMEAKFGNMKITPIPYI